VKSIIIDVELSPAPSITYRTIGGCLNFLIMLGPEPDQVVQQYLNVIQVPVFTKQKQACH